MLDLPKSCLLAIVILYMGLLILMATAALLVNCDLPGVERYEVRDI